MTLIDTYISDLELFSKSKQTIKASRNTLLKFAENRNLLEVDTNVIKEYLRSLNNISNQSKNNYIQRISIFYDYLIEEKLYNETNPCNRILKELKRAPKNRIRETTILSVDDVRNIVLKASNPRERSMILLFYKTGIRLNELAQLKVEDIDLDNKIATIQKRKGGKKGIVLFDDECKRWLKAYYSIRNKDEERFFGINIVQIGNIIRDIGKRLGIKLKPHDFRHAFTSHLQEARCHPEVIRELRGDSKRDMVSYYTHFTKDKNREEYERAIPKLGV